MKVTPRWLKQLFFAWNKFPIKRVCETRTCIFWGGVQPPNAQIYFFMGWGLSLLKRSVMMETSWYTSVIQREDEAGWREEEEEKADSQQKTRTPHSDVGKDSKIMRAFCFGNSWCCETMDRLWSIHRGEKYSVRGPGKLSNLRWHDLATSTGARQKPKSSREISGKGVSHLLLCRPGGKDQRRIFNVVNRNRNHHF